MLPLYEGQPCCCPSPSKNMKILKILFLIIMIAFGIFSVGCFLYPTVSNMINERYNESKINEYNSNVNTSSDSEIQAELRKAAQYNRIIAADYFSEEPEKYESEPDYTQNDSVKNAIILEEIVTTLRILSNRMGNMDNRMEKLESKFGM